MEEQGMKPRSNHLKLSAIKSFYRYCMEENKTKKNPTLTVHTPKKDDSLPYYLSKRQVALLQELTKEDPRDRAIVETLYATGVQQKAGGKINISVKNKYGSQQVTISIVDKTPPGVPTINIVKTSSKTVTGKSEVNATVYVEAGDKVLSSAKVNSNGNYTVKIKTQKEGTNLTVYAKDQAGNKGKSIKVKK